MISKTTNNKEPSCRQTPASPKQRIAGHLCFARSARQARNDTDAGKSRRDGTLLTVDFNLRNMSDIRVSQSPAGTTLCNHYKYRPCGTWVACVVVFVRRLKPTVNKVLSLRDSSPQTTLLQVIIFSFHNILKYETRI